jgi:hypothetical protein
VKFNVQLTRLGGIKMKKMLLLAMITIAGLVALQSCGGNKNNKGDGGEADFVEVNDPFEALTDMSNEIISAGGVAAVGEGTSKRRDISKEKARTSAQGRLAEMYETKVQRLKRQFLEEVGSEEDSEVNEAFSAVTKTVASKVLKGAIVKKTKIVKDPKTNKYITGVVMAIDTKTVNNSLLDEMKSKPKLYERFRASQAYKDLDKEMEKFEKEQKDGM